MGQGKDFEDEFRLSGNLSGVWIHRLNDEVQQPADYVLVYRGRSCLVELKSIHKSRFPFSMVEHHQLYGLLGHVKSGKGLSYVIVRVYQETADKGRHKGCYAIPVRVFYTMKKSGIKSLSQEELEAHELIITLQTYKSGGRIGWNLRPLWKS